MKVNEVFRTMQVLVLSSKEQRLELVGESNVPGIEWAEELDPNKRAEVVIDQCFDNSVGRAESLRKTGARLIVVNSVIETLADSDPSFVRINGWNTFLKGETIEAAALDESRQKEAEEVFSLFQKKTEWLADEPGFVTPRIISMIVNEAYFALSEGVSTKEEINTAMKLGTNYPYGPFEWAEKIGLRNIASLLQKLAEKKDSYAPCALLLLEAGL